MDWSCRSASLKISFHRADTHFSDAKLQGVGPMVPLCIAKNVRISR